MSVLNIDLAGYKKAITVNENTKILIEKKKAQISEVSAQIAAKQKALDSVEQRMIVLQAEKTRIEQNAVVAIEQINQELSTLLASSKTLAKESGELHKGQIGIVLDFQKIRKAQKQNLETLIQIVDGGRDIEFTLAHLDIICNFYADARERHKTMMGSANSIYLDEHDKSRLLKLLATPSLDISPEKINDMPMPLQNTPASLNVPAPSDSAAMLGVVSTAPEPLESYHYSTPPNMYAPLLQQYNYAQASSPSPVTSPMRVSLAHSASHISYPQYTPGSMPTNIPPPPTYVNNHTVPYSAAHNDEGMQTEFAPTVTPQISYPFLHEPHISNQYRLITAVLCTNANTAQRTLVLQGLPSNALIQKGSPSSMFSQSEDSTHWATLQTVATYPVFYTWQEYYYSLLPKLVSPDIAAGLCILPTLLRIPSDVMNYVLSQVAPKNHYNSINAWSSSIAGSIIVVADNLVDEIQDLSEINQIAYRFKINDIPQINAFINNRPKLLQPCVHYTRILEEYTKYMFPARTMALENIIQGILTELRKTPSSPFIPLIVVAKANGTVKLAKYIKSSLMPEPASTTKTGGKKAKHGTRPFAISSGDVADIVNNMPRIKEVIAMVGTITDALVNNSQYFINLTNLDKSAPLTIPPYHFMDSVTKSIYKKRANPELAAYDHDAECFRPKPFTLGNDGKCVSCECVLDLDYYGSLIHRQKSPSNGMPNINKAKTYSICGYTHCRCPSLNYCISCLVLMWLNSFQFQANTHAQPMVSCGRCNYSWSLASIFPVKQE